MRKILWAGLALALACALTAAVAATVTGGKFWPTVKAGGIGDPASEADSALPAGYTLSVVASGMHHPTDMAILPNGDILVALKGTGLDLEGQAEVRLVRDGVVHEPPALTLSANASGDSGLMSIMLDPGFASNRQLYLWYSIGQDALNWSGERVNRLSRFVYDPNSGTINPASETIILDNVLWGYIHNGGGLLFDKDGTLFVTTGDADRASDASGNLPQDMTSLNGKVLRIRPQRNGYSVPNDNPYVGVLGTRPEIYAAGLRNPFRITQRKSDGKTFVADVGASAWEEVNLLAPKANYGWPTREGPCPRGVASLPCAPAPAHFADPVFYYGHDRLGPAALTALTFVETHAFPAAMRGKLLYGDYNGRSLYATTLAADPSDPSAHLSDGDFTIDIFASGVGRIVDVEMTEDGLYLLDFQVGRILLVEYTGGSNQAPTAQLSASPTLGRAPLTVAFSGAGSTDDESGLRYRWDFGDGSEPITTTHPTTSRRYTADGNYRATLTVIDRFGAESETLEMPVTVYSGALPQIVLENLTEPGRERYHGGDRFRYRVERSGGTEGLDDKTPFLWTVELVHNNHTHPNVADFAAPEGEYDIPTRGHDLNADIRYRFLLTMQTADGIGVQAARDLEPHYTSLLVSTWPVPHPVFVDGAPIESGSNLTAIVGEQYVLDAPPESLYQDSINEFAYWIVTDGWPIAPEQEPQIWYSRTLTLTVPVSDTAFVAHYTRTRPLGQTFVPLVRR